MQVKNMVPFFCLPDWQRFFSFLMIVLSADDMRCISSPILEAGGLLPGESEPESSEPRHRYRHVEGESGTSPPQKKKSRENVGVHTLQGDTSPFFHLFSGLFPEGTNPSKRMHYHGKLPGPLPGIAQRSSSGERGGSHIQSLQTAPWYLTVPCKSIAREHHVGRPRREIVSPCRQQRETGRKQTVQGV